MLTQDTKVILLIELRFRKYVRIVQFGHLFQFLYAKRLLKEPLIHIFNLAFLMLSQYLKSIRKSWSVQLLAIQNLPEKSGKVQELTENIIEIKHRKLC